MKKFWSDEGGAVATEYAIIVTLIALVIVAGVTYFGLGLNQWFTNMGESVNNIDVPAIQTNQ